MSKNPGMLDDFKPIMPSLIRLLAGAIVLLVVQGIVLSLPGITQNVANTTFTVSSLAILMIGLVAAIVVLKFGTQLANAVGEAYESMKNYAPVLGWFFQVAALWLLYVAFKGVSGSTFSSAPWAYPLIFLVLAIIPTVKVVVNIVHVLEGNTNKHAVSRAV